MILRIASNHPLAKRPAIMSSSNKKSGFRRAFLLGSLVILISIVSNYSGLPSGALIGLILGIAIVTQIVVPEVVEWKRNQWRFSLRTLLIAISLAAVLLGIAVYVVRE